MPSFTRHRARCLAAAAILALPATALQASVVDFEAPGLVGVYLPGESFEQGGFRFLQGLDAGVVDVGSALGASAPGNNAGQFYSSLNDGFLQITTLDGSAFRLDGFSAAYLPQTAQADNPPSIVLVALGTTMEGARYSTYFSLGDTTTGQASFPFLQFAAPADFTMFGQLRSLQFFTCVAGDGPICRSPAQNQGQFALDNLLITSVPEASPLLMLSTGLALLAWLGRRRSR